MFTLKVTLVKKKLKENREHETFIKSRSSGGLLHAQLPVLQCELTLNGTLFQKFLLFFSVTDILLLMHLNFLFTFGLRIIQLLSLLHLRCDFPACRTFTVFDREQSEQVFRSNLACTLNVGFTINLNLFFFLSLENKKHVWTTAHAVTSIPFLLL